MKIKQLKPLAVLLQAFVLAFVIAVPAFAELKSPQEAFDAAADLSTLTQYLLKSYLQLGQGIRPGKASKELKEAIKEFDTNIAELKAYSPNNDVTQALSNVESIWSNLKPIFSADPERNKAEKLRADTEQLLKANETMVELLEGESSGNQMRLIRAVEYLGMLGLRMSGLLMLKGWGFTNDAYTKDLNSAVEQFNYTLEELKDAEENTAKIKRKLKDIEKQFKRLQKGAQAGTSKFILGMIAGSVDKLLDRTQHLVELYEETAE